MRQVIQWSRTLPLFLSLTVSFKLIFFALMCEFINYFIYFVSVSQFCLAQRIFAILRFFICMYYSFKKNYTHTIIYLYITEENKWSHICKFYFLANRPIKKLLDVSFWIFFLNNLRPKKTIRVDRNIRVDILRIFGIFNGCVNFQTIRAFSLYHFGKKTVSGKRRTITYPKKRITFWVGEMVCRIVKMGT